MFKQHFFLLAYFSVIGSGFREKIYYIPMVFRYCNLKHLFPFFSVSFYKSFKQQLDFQKKYFRQFLVILFKSEFFYITSNRLGAMLSPMGCCPMGLKGTEVFLELNNNRSNLSHKKEKKDKTECFTHRFSKQAHKLFLFSKIFCVRIYFFCEMNTISQSQINYHSQHFYNFFFLRLNHTNYKYNLLKYKQGQLNF